MTKTFKILILVWVILGIISSTLIVFCIFSIKKTDSETLDSGFEVEDISESEKENIGYNFSLISAPTANRTFVVFDVNENGMIALGHDLSNLEKRISVYDSDGNFKYGYSFESYGSFGVEWDGDYLNVYMVRSNLLITLDHEANIIEIAKVPDTNENRNHINNYIFATEKTIGDEKYTMRKKLGAFSIIATSYTQLSKTSYGEEVIVYKANQGYSVGTFLIPLAIVALFVVGISVILYPVVFRKH